MGGGLGGGQDVEKVGGGESGTKRSQPRLSGQPPRFAWPRHQPLIVQRTDPELVPPSCWDHEANFSCFRFLWLHVS